MENTIRTRVVDEFVKVVKIDSLSLKEEKMFAYLRQRLTGFPVEIEFLPYFIEELGAGSGNMIVKLPANETGRKSIFFDSHIDTVEPGIGIKPVVTGDRIASDGTTILGSDDKAGTAAMLTALDEILSSDIKHGDIYFLFTSAEEIGLTGVHYLDYSKIKTDFGFILDSHGKIGGVVVAAPYHIGYEINVKGKASHAGIAPELGINAIKIAARIIGDLPQGKLSKDTVANVGVIDGGQAINIIPEDCLIKGELRSHNTEDVLRLKAEINQAVEKQRKDALDITLEFNELYKGFSFSKNDEIIKFAKKAVESLGLTPRFERTGGGSNTNLYNQFSLTSVNLAVGMMDVHSTGEYIEIDDLENAVKLILAIVKTA
ncbi:MAG: M20/M25/M40 family metallo-hydrolase [Brevinematales bacterium]|jgi:tripeptide aminopeptidase